MPRFLFRSPWFWVALMALGAVLGLLGLLGVG